MKHIHLPWAFFVKSGILQTSVYNVCGSQNEFVDSVTRVFILGMCSLEQNGPLRRDAVFAVAIMHAQAGKKCKASLEISESEGRRLMFPHWSLYPLFISSFAEWIQQSGAQGEIREQTPNHLHLYVDPAILALSKTTNAKGIRGPGGGHVSLGPVHHPCKSISEKHPKRGWSDDTHSSLNTTLRVRTGVSLLNFLPFPRIVRGPVRGICEFDTLFFTFSCFRYS